MQPTKLESILERLHDLQAELDAEIEHILTEKREQFRYTLERGRIRFEEGIRALQLRQRTGLWKYFREAQLAHVLTAPVVYSLLLPLALLDAAVTLYQQICFRAYGVRLVPRADFVVIDRHYLAYLNGIEKLNCIFCGYANGVIAYSREIAARTEQYWCPIKHASRARDAHRLIDNFVDYGDADAYLENLEKLRTAIRQVNGG